jgi:GT2 family glycosyltransferase
MWIDVSIPYSETNQLAEAYNRALKNSSAEWILFLDHDVFLCNPLWYEMCLEAIKNLKADPLAACVGCAAGGQRHRRTMDNGFVPNADIEYHIKESKKQYAEYEGTLQKWDEYMAGYFLLLKREVAEKIGFHQVNSSINNIDQDFGTRLLEAGYHIYFMPGLYVYHRRGMKRLKLEFINEVRDHNKNR